MQAIEPFPTKMRLYGQTFGNVTSGFAELAPEQLNSIGENSQFMQEARPVGKKHAVQDLIPGSGTTARVTAEKGGIEGFDRRKHSQTPPAQRESLAQRGQSLRQRLEQFGSDRNLLPGADQLSAAAQGNRFVERDAHHGKVTLPLPDERIKGSGLFARQSSLPIFTDPSLGALRWGSKEHA